MFDALKNHWLEFVCEAVGLGAFMISACFFAVLLFHPQSPLSFLDASFRLVLMGLAMGTTAILIIYSPFGKLSGAHINPSVTLTFWRLGKVKTNDAIFYAVFQFIGASGGVFLSWLILGDWLAEVQFVVTIPGKYGSFVSFVSEFGISFLLMTTVLVTSNNRKLSRYTPFFAGFLVATYISFESPISGMSMNPARTFGSAIVAGVWNSWWIYFLAPPLAMLAAAEVYVRIKGWHSVFCAKFHHHNKMRCIFNCNFDELEKVV